MKNFIIHNTTYTRILQKDNFTLLKYSPVSKEAWTKLQEQNIEFLNIPIKVKNITPQEKIIHPESNTKIELPYLQNYETLGHNKELNNLTTKQLLLLIQKITQKIKQMHKANIYHTDIHSENIMINDKDIKIIDLDAVLLKDYISTENIYIEDEISFTQKQKLSQKDDKQSILNLLLYYLKNGTFKYQMNDFIDIHDLNFPKNIQKEILTYQLEKQIPEENYYYEDILEELIKKKYKSPKLITRKWIKNKKNSIIVMEE